MTTTENRLDNGLYYSDSEILTMFKHSRDKLKQLIVLAELNLCFRYCKRTKIPNTTPIKEALLRAGLDPAELPTTKKNYHVVRYI